MERGIFAKNAHLIGNVLLVREDRLRMKLEVKNKGITNNQAQKTCSNLGVSKSEHDNILYE